MKRSMLMTEWSPRIPDRWLCGILVGLILGTGTVAAVDAPGLAATLPGHIALQDGKLTAQLTAVPLHQVMEEVSRLSGARVRWLSNQAEEKSVSVEFRALSLPEALRRILGKTNFLLLYAREGEDTTLTQIWISPKGRDGGLPELIPPPASQSDDTLEGQEEPDAVPVDTLIQTAVSTLDPSVRVEAIARLGEYVPADPRIEGILSHLAGHDNDPQVQAAASEVLAGIE